MSEAQRIEQIKAAMLAKVEALLPSEQTYVNFFVPYVAGIKWLHPDGTLGLYDARCGQLEPHSIQDLPVESLAVLYDHLTTSNGNV